MIFQRSPLGTSGLSFVGRALVAQGLGAALVLAWTEARAQDETAPLIFHTSITEAPEGLPLLVRVEIEDESPIFAPAVYFRTADTDGEYNSIPLRGRGAQIYDALIPGIYIRSSLEYFVEAFDDQGNGPARVGTPSMPLRVRVLSPRQSPLGLAASPDVVASRPTKKGGSVLETWWFWTLVGVAAAGAGAAVAVALSSGNPDEYVVEVRGPNPTSGLP